MKVYVLLYPEHLDILIKKYFKVKKKKKQKKLWRRYKKMQSWMRI